MQGKTKVLEFRTKEDVVIFRVYIFEEESSPKGNQQKKGGGVPSSRMPSSGKSNTPKNEGAKSHPSNSSHGNGSAKMTDAQRRYLFRILAEEGIEGNDATDYLKELFQVNSLEGIGKYHASQMIDYLLQEQNEKKQDQEGGYNDRSSF